MQNYDFYKNKIILAPMAGVTDLPFRLMCKKYGADLVYSEMISARGMHYSDRKTNELTLSHPDEQPLIVQIFGNEPEFLAESAQKLVSQGVTHLDINMGCPTPKITSNGDGSALMREPEKVSEAVRAVVKSVNVPVSVKIRAGWDEKSINAVEIAKRAEDAGASAITVHGRTRMQFYTGKSNRNIIADVKRAVSIPVIGNGDIFTPQDASDMLNETSCDSVMIGRGSEGNPFIFSEIKEFLEGKPITPLTFNEKMNTALEQIELMVEFKGEEIGILESRKHIAWYFKGLRGASTMKQKAFCAKTLNEIKEIIYDLSKENM